MKSETVTVRRRTAAWSEAFGALFALALAATTVSLILGSPRALPLFRDGDALLPVLIAQSLGAGQPQDWAMSSVLFLPELAVFLPFSALPISSDLALALAGVVWFTLLYAALRLVSGRRTSGASPVIGALLGQAAFCVIALSESSVSRDAADLASMLASSTYYAATVVASVATVGLISRLDGGRRVVLLVALGALSALSMLSNPLYAVWGILPALVFGAIMLRQNIVMPALVMVAAGALGLAARLLFGDTIVKSGFGYIQPMQAFTTLGTYLQGFGARLAEPGGILGTALVTATMVIAIVVAVRARQPRIRFIAAMAGFAPILVFVAMVIMGGEVVRYLQPFAFYPVLLFALVRTSRGSTIVGAVLTAVAVAIAGWSSATAVRVETARVDADLACLVSFVDEADYTGAGQYWSIRLPKSQLEDPRKLIQVDHQLQGYDWLVNRDDYRDAKIHYLVTESGQARDVEFAPADPGVLAGASTLNCGRYTITVLVGEVPVEGFRNAG